MLQYLIDSDESWYYESLFDLEVIAGTRYIPWRMSPDSCKCTNKRWDGMASAFSSSWAIRIDERCGDSDAIPTHKLNVRHQSNLNEVSGRCRTIRIDRRSQPKPWIVGIANRISTPRPNTANKWEENTLCKKHRVLYSVTISMLNREKLVHETNSGTNTENIGFVKEFSWSKQLKIESFMLNWNGLERK